MTPSHSVKQSKRYRYYMTRERKIGAPAIWRVPAHDLEQLVIARLCRHFVESAPVGRDDSLGAHDDVQRKGASHAAQLTEGSDIERTNVIQAQVERIDVRRDCVELTLQSTDGGEKEVLTAPATLVRSGRQTRLVPPGTQTTGVQPPDEKLVRLIANAHAARLAISNSDNQSIEAIANQQGFTSHYFAQLARLGGLAPDIVTAILEGRQPASVTRTRLARTKALPLDWNEQRRMLGFA